MLAATLSSPTLFIPVISTLIMLAPTGTCRASTATPIALIAIMLIFMCVRHIAMCTLHLRSVLAARLPTIFRLPRAWVSLALPIMVLLMCNLLILLFPLDFTSRRRSARLPSGDSHIHCRRTREAELRNEERGGCAHSLRIGEGLDIVPCYDGRRPTRPVWIHRHQPVKRQAKI